MFRVESTRGWLMESRDGLTMEAWLNAHPSKPAREPIDKDPDPAVLQALIDRGRLEP